MRFNMKFANRYDLKMKPTFLRNWKYIRTTKTGKCYIMFKEGHGELTVPAKFVTKIILKENGN